MVEFDKIKSLGWSPNYNFENSLPETVEWYLANETWWKKDLENIRK